VDLYLDGKLKRISSFIVGQPVPPTEHLRQTDDFDNHKTMWGSAHQLEGRGDYKNENGLGVITVKGRDVTGWKHSGESFGDILVEVDATPLGDPVAYGVVVRSKDEHNFYTFLITTKGEFAVLMVDDGKLVWIVQAIAGRGRQEKEKERRVWSRC